MIETLNRTNSQQNQNQTHPRGEIIYKYVYQHISTILQLDFFIL
jgi:hypothetical protein